MQLIIYFRSKMQRKKIRCIFALHLIQFICGGETMNLRETYNLEFKSKLTDTFLKTVSAFANYNDGAIIFGVNDNGETAKLHDLKKVALDIENKINDSIEPRPDYKIDIDEENGKVILKVFESEFKPYLLKNKAYMRRDSSSVPVEDRDEFKRLILSGTSQSFEELPAKTVNLTFNVLENALIKSLNIEKLSMDNLKTLGLYTDKKGYNIAAELVADKNSFRLIDIVRFGSDINVLKERVQLDGISILSAYEQAIEVYRRYYQYEKIDGVIRSRVEKIPEDAFREAIANALVHRDWSIQAAIRISMFDDYIEITSPGGLPIGISEEEYINGQVSILKNEKIGSLFNRLGLIERFGTGIKRIRYTYRNSLKKPIFKVYLNSIMIDLPIIMQEISGLSKNSSYLLNFMKNDEPLTRLQLDKLSGFEKTKTLRALEELINESFIRKIGKGKGTKYIKN